MLYIAISVAFLFVIGSVMWLRPSPTEKRLAQLRQAAMQNGLRVGWMSVKDAEWLSQPNKKWIRYACLRPQLNERLQLLRWLRQPEGWQPKQHDKRLTDDFGLPAGVAAIEITAQDCAIIWAEEGNVQDVQTIAAALKKIAALKF